MAYLSLSDTMDSAKPLLNTVGIPREIIIHHQVCTL